MRNPFPFRETAVSVAETSAVTERLVVLKHEIDMAIGHGREAIEQSQDALRRTLDSVRQFGDDGLR